jgi:hypothetical protein
MYIVKVRVLLLSAILPLTLMACSSAPKPVSFIVEANANQVSAIAIDLIAVSDSATAAQLVGLSGADWFQNKDAYMLQNAHTLSVQSLELVPRTQLSMVKWPSGKKQASHYFVAANFLIRPEFLPVDAYGVRTITVKQHKLELTYRK